MIVAPPRQPGGARRNVSGVRPEPAAVLMALAEPVVVIDQGGAIRLVNPAAEQFFGTGAVTLCGSQLGDHVGPHSPLLGLVASAWRSGNTIAEYDMPLEGARLGRRSVTIHGAPAGDMLVLTLHEHSMVDAAGGPPTHRNAARSMTGMAAMLAHEIKNPLAGIRGAAQLLEQDANAAGRQLTRLICEETDRIVGLVDRMEAFSDNWRIERAAVNIHEVLERVRRLALSGFAHHTRFVEEYDPSLPPVYGNRDLLVQVFVNIVKNAAEAVPATGGEIVLTTRYRHGPRLERRGGEGGRHLPLMVAVGDNGPGIPAELRTCLFDPFVTTKSNGTGLGLALVAKVIGDHGGVIEFDSRPGRTVFRVLLPMVAQDSSGS